MLFRSTGTTSSGANLTDPNGTTGGEPGSFGDESGNSGGAGNSSGGNDKSKGGKKIAFCKP